MKYIVILGDGMADYPLEQLGGKTPLQCASKPYIDRLAEYGEVGMVKTIPDGIAPGSDVANLSVLGYDPRKYYTGRSPLEAVSMGIELSATDVAMRCNLVCLSDEHNYEEKRMVDYSSDEITTEEAKILIEVINSHFKTSNIEFHPGISYRHCMVWHKAEGLFQCTPPHDIAEKNINQHLPKGDNSELILDMMKRSYDILTSHPVNKSRIARGLRPANSIWLWGDGKKPSIPSFFEKYGVTGSTVSAVDLIKGIGICAGLNSVDVVGATGNINTNFKGKAIAALKELNEGKDFVYIHIEAPDESGHRFEIENKIKSIEMIDRDVVATIIEGMSEYKDYCIMILPDHPTPLSLRTHTSDPVPYIIYKKSAETLSGVKGYDEFQAQSTGLFIEEGFTIMDRFLKK